MVINNTIKIDTPSVWYVSVQRVSGVHLASDFVAFYAKLGPNQLFSMTESPHADGNLPSAISRSAYGAATLVLIGVTVGERGGVMAGIVQLPKADGFIGVFDSGVGGISVLQHLVNELPAEDFHFFGDSAHAPYGAKTPEEVCELSLAIAERMVADGAKALVIACNTATSAAAPMLRERYPHMPVVGVEPALKPAVLAQGSKDVLVMATEVTLALDKFQRLTERWASGVGVQTVACTGAGSTSLVVLMSAVGVVLNISKQSKA